MNHAINAISNLSEAPEYWAEDIIDLMERLGANETAFAMLMNVTTETVSNWTEGLTFPGNIAKRLMQVYDVCPEIIEDIMSCDSSAS